MRRQRLTLLFLLILGVALWLARGWWFPSFQVWLPQLAGDIGNQIQSLEAFVGLVVLVGSALWAGWRWLAHNDQQERRDDELLPLKPTTWQAIRNRSHQGARVQWIDRSATDANQLRSQPRLALIGLSGEGKSREAAELIRRAIEIELLPETQVFEPNRDFLNAGATISNDTLDKVVDLTQRAFLFVDDLHSYHLSSLEKLADLLTAFTRPPLDHRYVAATVRSDLVSAAQSAWLAQQKFQMVRLPKIDTAQAEAWLTSAANVHNLTLTKKVRQAFIEQNQTGTPGHLLRGLLTVKSSVTGNNRGRSQIKPAQVMAVMSNIAAQERQLLLQRAPAAAALLTALAHFHAAEVRAAHPLILVYSVQLWRIQKPRPTLWSRLWARRVLQRALTYLTHFDVSVEEGLIVAPDYLLESAEATAARQQVGDFLKQYRRPFHNRWLRRLHRHRDAQRWALFMLAWNCQNQQEQVMAIRFYSAAIRVAPHPSSYNNRGNARADQGDLTAAIADYSQAIQLDPQDATAYNNRGNARADQGDLTAALADYDQAIQLNPRHADAYNNRGVARADLGDLTAAIADYNQAIQLDPQHAEAYNNRGKARADLGNLTAALADYDQAIALFPPGQDKAITYTLRGNAHYDRSDFIAAIGDYDQAIQLNPQYATAYNKRGIARYAQGDLTTATADHDQAIQLSPQDAYAYFFRGHVHEAQSDLTAALADYSQAIQLNPLFAIAYFFRGYIHEVQSDLTAAIADYNQAIQLNPKYAIAYRFRGNAHKNMGNPIAAIADYDQAIQLNPQDANAYYDRGNARYVQDDLAAAIADYDQAIKLHPQDAMAYGNRGLARAVQGDFTAAIADYDQAIALFLPGKGKATAYNNRGNAHKNMSNPIAAIADYDQAIQLNPQDAMTYVTRGLTYQAIGNFERTIEDLKLAHELFTLDNDKAFAQVSLGHIYARQASYEQAVKAYQQAIQLGWPTETLYAMLGRSLHQLACWPEAQTAYAQAVTLEPEQFLLWLGMADVARHQEDDIGYQFTLDQARRLLKPEDIYGATGLESVAGNSERALVLLEQALATGAVDVTQAHQDPELYWIRQEPRFVEIAAGKTERLETKRLETKRLETKRLETKRLETMVSDDEH